MNQNSRLTEQSMDGSKGIDTRSGSEILAALVSGQERAVAAVGVAIPQIAIAAAALAKRLAAGGRLAYAGAGTSIRIAVQDGSELHATFGMAENKILYLIAGGKGAIFETMANAEDDVNAGQRDADQLFATDTLVAVAASGSTPYTIAVAKRAKAKGAFVIAVVNNSGSALGVLGDVEIVVNSGPEVIAGSTRMAAGTAQKAALNLLSTLAHIHLGAVYDGLMVNVHLGNDKLKQRGAEIVSKISQVSLKQASAALDKSQNQVKTAVLLCSGALDISVAHQILEKTKGNLRLALVQLKKDQT